MTLLNVLGISDAFSANSATPAQGSGLSTFLPMMLLFILGAYFLIIRPQNKRMKAHRKLISELTKGDEVVTAGGLVGRVSKLGEEFISLLIAENVEINVQKSAVTNVLPKGTLKAI